MFITLEQRSVRGQMDQGGGGGGELRGGTKSMGRETVGRGRGAICVTLIDGCYG